MTLIHTLDLDIPKMYPYTKNELSRSKLSNVRARTEHTDRQTDRQTDAIKRITSRNRGS